MQSRQKVSRKCHHPLTPCPCPPHGPFSERQLYGVRAAPCRFGSNPKPCPPVLGYSNGNPPGSISNLAFQICLSFRHTGQTRPFLNRLPVPLTALPTVVLEPQQFRRGAEARLPLTLPMRQPLRPKPLAVEAKSHPLTHLTPPAPNTCHRKRLDTPAHLRYRSKVRIQSNSTRSVSRPTAHPPSAGRSRPAPTRHPLRSRRPIRTPLPYPHPPFGRILIPASLPWTTHNAPISHSSVPRFLCGSSRYWRSTLLPHTQAFAKPPRKHLRKVAKALQVPQPQRPRKVVKGLERKKVKTIFDPSLPHLKRSPI